MPPKKKTTTRKKTTARKAPAKKGTTRKRTTRKKKQDNKLSIGILFAVIPVILLAAFLILRFSGEKPLKTVEKPPAKVVKQKTVVKKVEVEKVHIADEIKLYMFEKGFRSSKLDIEGSKVKISASTEKEAGKIREGLRKYLKGKKITVDGRKILTAENSEELYTISFHYPKPKPMPAKAPVVKKDIPKPVKYKAKLAVVIDDCGYNVSLAKRLGQVKYPVTFAVLPYTPYGRETAKIARQYNKTLFIHFPMQPKSYPKFDPGKGALFLNMPESLIASVTKANFEYFGMKLDGANNHTGSAFTENRTKMNQALKYIGRYTNRFLDSHTSGSSQAYEVCQKKGMLCAENNIFLDNEEPGLITTDDKQNHVHGQLMKAARKALRNGEAIAIGHLRENTVSVLNSTFREIEKMGVRIVPVTSLMD